MKSTRYTEPNYARWSMLSQENMASPISTGSNVVPEKRCLNSVDIKIRNTNCIDLGSQGGDEKANQARRMELEEEANN